MAAWATRITRRELIPQETQMVPSGSLTSDTRDMRAILGNGVIKSGCDLQGDAGKIPRGVGFLFGYFC